jgi:predicted SprT family Zn-dependent metalloprotease
MSTLSEVASLTRQLMNEHGLGHWNFEFDRAKRRAGLCKHHSQTISLSHHFVIHNVDKPENIRDVILHEIAHALVGPRLGHNHIWKAKAREIGAKPIRCTNASMPKTLFVGRCQNCGCEFNRHRRKAHIYHAKCGSEKGKIVFTRAN